MKKLILLGILGWLMYLYSLITDGNIYLKIISGILLFLISLQLYFGQMIVDNMELKGLKRFLFAIFISPYFGIGGITNYLLELFRKGD